MSFVENISAVEAILFAYGEPVPKAVLSEGSGIDQESLEKIITLLNDRYDETGSALQVLKLGDSFQLATRLEYQIKQLDKKDKEELILTQDLKQFLKDKVDCDEYVIMDVEGMIE